MLTKSGPLADIVLEGCRNKGIKLPQRRACYAVLAVSKMLQQKPRRHKTQLIKSSSLSHSNAKRRTLLQILHQLRNIIKILTKQLLLLRHRFGVQVFVNIHLSPRIT